MRRLTMVAQVELDRDDFTYTYQDTVTGKVVIDAFSLAKISNISVTLSGIAISRLDSRKESETHRVSDPQSHI